MAGKPTYGQLEQRVKGLEKKAFEYKLAEEALRESTRRLELAYDQSIIYAKQLNEKVAERKRVEEALQEARNQLEDRVEKRTAEFSKANALLEREIAERRRAEGALRESEVRLKTVLDTIQAGIVVIDPETHIIVGINAAAGKMVGAPREQILGSVCQQHICPADKGQCPITDLGQSLENAEQVLLTTSGKRVPILKTAVSVVLAGREHLLESFLDITERKQAEEERERLIGELQEALAKVKTLSGLLPICASCKRIRDDQGYWQQIEAYIRDHSEAEFSHSVCPECAKKLYPEIFDKK